MRVKVAMAIRVSLIEDHDLTRLSLEVAIKQQPDMEWVGSAATGEEGLTLFKIQMPDVAIVDIGLPGMDGIDVVRQLRAFQGDEVPVRTKVLMLTMHDADEAVLAAFAAGADSYCLKQIALDKLMSAVRDTYEGNSWIDPAIASIVLRQVRQKLVNNVGEADKVSIYAVEAEYAHILEVYPLTKQE
jgi:DNA-binding NarL/FixJ family response regulator